MILLKSKNNNIRLYIVEWHTENEGYDICPLGGRSRINGMTMSEDLRDSFYEQLI